MFQFASTFILSFLDIVLHLDIHLQEVIEHYDLWVYLILFLIIFFETGFVITPFLPGDSLLFAAGAFAAVGSLNLFLLLIIFFFAAVLGDFANYLIGKYFGQRFFTKDNSLFFNKTYLVKTQHFYERYGKKTVVLARFIPIIRSFAPFVAGIGRMDWGSFVFYNIIGGILWCLFFVFGGYYLGNLPFVKENFALFILIIIFISALPLIKEAIFLLMKKETKS